LITILKYVYQQVVDKLIVKNYSLSCTQNENLFSDKDYYKILSKKYLIINRFFVLI